MSLNGNNIEKKLHQFDDIVWNGFKMIPYHECIQTNYKDKGAI